MPLRPFPSPINIGTDICSIRRIQQLYERAPARFLRKLFTPRELSEYNHRIVPRSAKKRVEYIAGRWAAKEACIKAVQPRRVTLQEVEIVRLANRRAPFAIVLDTVAEHPVLLKEDEPEVHREHKVKEDGKEGEEQPRELAGVRVGVVRRVVGPTSLAMPGDVPQIKVQDIEGQVVKISISHDGDYTTAVAIAPEMPELESMTTAPTKVKKPRAWSE